MGASYQSEVEPIRSVAMKHARDAFHDQETIARQWQELGYLGAPDLNRALAESDAFVGQLQDLGIEVHLLPKDDRVGLDSLYARDSALVCDQGVILCRMGKAQRRGEPDAVEAAYRELGLPIHGAISGEGRLEGGDVVWLDEGTLVVGRGYRTNDEGIRQLGGLLDGHGIEILTVPLPHWRGPADVFHLMSILSPLDRDLALVHSPLMPVPFREELRARGMELVEVDGSEFDTMAGNVLALAPRRCLMLAGNPRTRSRLESAGVEVLVYEGAEISAKGCGGPTCLTRPLLRGTLR
jgi:N-dimethylarginine dimethylaminohydrolase